MRRPSPRQSAHGLGIISPVPLQREQATLVTTCPSSDWRTRRSSPVPWQSMQVTGSVPAAVPLPSHVAQVAGSRTVISLRLPNTASANSSSRRTSASAPTWGPRRRVPAPPIWPKNASKMSPRPPSKPKPATPAGLGAEDALGTEAVVAAPTLGVAQDLVGNGDLLEASLGLGVTVVGVGVQLAGAGAVGPLDLVVAGLGADPEQRVEVAQPVSDGHRAPR